MLDIKSSKLQKAGEFIPVCNVFWANQNRRLWLLAAVVADCYETEHGGKVIASKLKDIASNHRKNNNRAWTCVGDNKEGRFGKLLKMVTALLEGRDFIENPNNSEKESFDLTLASCAFTGPIKFLMKGLAPSYEGERKEDWSIAGQPMASHSVKALISLTHKLEDL